MEKISFTVKIKREKKINWSLKSMQRFPVHEHFLYEIQEIKVEYDYKPTRNFDKESFVDFMKAYLMKIYNAVEVSLNS